MRTYTEKMKSHLDTVRPPAGHSGAGGRPSKRQLVKKYRDDYPESTKYDCAKSTNMDYKTVSRWWDS